MTLRTPHSGTTTCSATLLASTLGAILLLGPTATVPVARAGKPAPPPAPVLPSVRYTLTWLEGDYAHGQPRGLNNAGVLVGFANDGQYPGTTTAFYSVTGEALDLNSLSAVWLDLDLPEGAQPASGWRATSAYGINDAGDIVGTAENTNPNLPTRAFILVNALGQDARMTTFLLMPSVGTGNQAGRAINNYGEAVGVAAPGTDSLGVVRYRPIGAAWPYYQAILAIPSAGIDGVMDINDDGVVVARRSSFPTIASYRQLSNGVTDVVAGHEFWAVSSGPLALISGSRDKTSGKKGLPGGAFRLPLLGAPKDAQVIYPGGAGNYARAINEQGDTVVEASGRGFQYFDPDANPNTPNPYGTNGNGILPLDHLVVNPDADWLDDEYRIRLDGINGRDSTGFGQICGYAYGPTRGFLLTPVPAP